MVVKSFRKASSYALVQSCDNTHATFSLTVSLGRIFAGTEQALTHKYLSLFILYDWMCGINVLRKVEFPQYVG